MTPLRRLAATASCAVAALFLSITPAVFAADTITLKSGQELVGEILRETKTDVTIEYNATPTIKDTRTIPRDEIADIHSETPDEVAFKELQSVLPAPDLLTPLEYQQVIDEGPAAFLAQFPNSELVPDVEAIVAELEAEKAKAEEGSRKFEGQWLSADEFERKKFNIEAAVLFKKTQSLADEGNYIEALRTFEKLEDNYAASKAYPEAVVLVRKVIPEYQEQLRTIQNSMPALIRERETGLAGLVGQEKQRMQQAIDAEKEKFQGIRAREEEAGVVWRSVSAYSDDDVKAALKTAETELGRVAKLDTAAMAEAAEFTAKALDEKARGNYEAAMIFIKRAEEKGAKSEYLASAKEEIANLQAQARERFESTGALDPTGEPEAAPAEDGTPAAEGGETPPAADTDAPAEIDQAESPAEDKADGGADVTAEMPAPLASPGAETPPVEPVEEEGGISIQVLLFGLLGVLLVILIVAMVMKKPKATDG